MGNQYFRQDGYVGPLSADGYSDSMPVGDARWVSIQADVTQGATLDGYLSVQGSNTDVDYVSIGLADTETGTIATEKHIQASGSFLFLLPNITCGFLRTKWRKNTGTGSFLLNLQKKR